MRKASKGDRGSGKGDFRWTSISIWREPVDTEADVAGSSGETNSVTVTQARSWPELVAVHDRFVEDYNAQRHRAHRERQDGRRSPSEVLGFLSGVRHREEELRRAFFSSRFACTLDSLGYAAFGTGASTARRRWRAGRRRCGSRWRASPWSTRASRSRATR